ncbi:MAG: hypothetical protein J0L91_01310 [Burkholderiales bacterium]|nr:hypothetical protein [Burkholderiales bacterium]
MPARLQDNPDSWIRYTDLVFIDQVFIDLVFIDLVFIDLVFIDLVFIDLIFIDLVGTGLSRMLPGPDGKPRDAKPCPRPGQDEDTRALTALWRQNTRR